MKVSQLLPSLRHAVDLPFEEKLKRSRHIIEMFAAITGGKHCVVSCSFGKDSMVVLYLVREKIPNVDVLFNNTGVQYWETYEFKKRMVKEWNLNLVETKPIKSFWQVAEKHGLPDGKKKADMCCDYLKDIPYRREVKKRKWKVSFTGLTCLESRTRMFNTNDRGQCYYSRKDNVSKVHPIVFWTSQEVLDYIAAEKIPLNPAYTKFNIERLGCVPCTSHKFWREQMMKTNPKLYAYISKTYFHQPLLTDWNKPQLLH